jgi:putative tryptophan/tyrosine transport system substrate-binding protein
VRAQQAAMPVVGFLGVSSLAKTGGGVLLDFKRGLAEASFVEDRNVAIEYRWADDHYDRLPALAAELVQRQVAVLATPGSPAALPAKAATTVIPIVFMIGSDPVRLGLVSSLNHPGGNLTGVSYFNEEIAPKRLNLLHDGSYDVPQYTPDYDPTDATPETVVAPPTPPRVGCQHSEQTVKVPSENGEVREVTILRC